VVRVAMTNGAAIMPVGRVGAAGLYTLLLIRFWYRVILMQMVEVEMVAGTNVVAAVADRADRFIYAPIQWLLEQIKSPQPVAAAEVGIMSAVVVAMDELELNTVVVPAQQAPVQVRALLQEVLISN
jgi:hypothetical protein